MCKNARTQQRSHRALRDGFFVAVAVVVVVEIIVDPRSVHPDGVAYLDIGAALLDRRAWAITAYFSPLYSVFVALVVRLAHASPSNEFLVVRAANGFVVMVAALAFESLLTVALDWLRRSTGPGVHSPADVRWRVFGYSLFVWTVIRNVGAVEATPDIGVLLWLLLAATLIIRWATPPDRSISNRRAALFGAVLALGYMTKSVFFVYALVFLTVFAVIFRRAPRQLLVACAVFMGCSAPWIAALSLSKGRFSFGETGRLNLVWYQSPVRAYTHWQGDEVGYGTPAHPTRRLMRSPEVFEFATPFPVSYPPWYDASYWYEGVELHLKLRAVLRTMVQNLKGTTPHLGVLVVFVTILLVTTRSVAPLAVVGGPLMSFVIPGIVAYGIYAPVAVYTRYLAGFALLFYLFVALAWASWCDGMHRSVVERCLPLLSLWFVLGTANVISRDARASIGPSLAIQREDDGDIRVAERLIAEGYAPGAGVAGIGTNGAYVYWPHLGRYRMVIESPGGPAGLYWRSAPAVRERILSLFRTAGAEVVVADSLPETPLGTGWTRVPASRFAYCSLRRTPLCDIGGEDSTLKR